MLSPDDGAPDASLADALRRAVAGQYEIESELGRGGMATVFLARDLRHGRTVAVKVMRRDVVAGDGTARFLQEIRTAARLTHPHILGVHDSGESDGLLYYVMPFVDGESLRARLARDGALPVADAVRIMRELADALAHAHARGVVHRDLKPENVLLAGGHAVIADFGIAKALAAALPDATAPTAAMTGTGMSLGTPAYMAPEQAIGDRSMDHRADLYALGVVAYEMLAGAHPFGARPLHALVAAHLTEAPVPPATKRSGIPPALDALVMRLMAKDPAARPSDGEDVMRALDDAAVHSVVSRAIPAPPRRRTRARIAASLIVLVVAGVLGVLAVRTRGAWLGGASGAAAGPIHTVAVLPFENIGGDKDDEYFSVGLTDELAHAIAQIPGVSVASREGSSEWRAKAATPQEIGRALDVAAIVTGRARRAGDLLRVTVQLVNTRDGKVLWDDRYESRSRDVFAVQDEFTRAIAGTLARSLGGSATAPVASVARGTTQQAAYDLFLKGQYFYLARGEKKVRQSIEYFRQAVVLDPSFARAHAALALAYGVLGVYVADPADTLTALVRASAERAMALDSTLAESHTAMAHAFEADLRFDEAIRQYRRAVELGPPSGSVYLPYGFMLLGSGHTEEALVALREALRLDPLVKSARTALAMGLAFARQPAEALAEAKSVMAVDSTFELTPHVLAMAYAVGGHGDSAVAAVERGAAYTRNLPPRRKYLMYAYAAAGRRRDVERLRDEPERADGPRFGAFDREYAMALLGDREPLVRILSTRAGQRRWYVENLHFGCNPLLDALQSDERFTAAMRTIGAVPCSLARQQSLPR